MKFIKPFSALALCLLLASCGSDKNADTNPSLSAQPANTAVENTGRPTEAPAAETFRTMQVAQSLQQNWLHLDPAFKLESNCIQLGSQASSSRVLFAGSSCPATGGVTREHMKFELFSEVAASPLDGEITPPQVEPKTEPKVEQGKQAPQVQRFILKLQQKVAAPIEQGKEQGKEPEQGQEQGKEEPKIAQQGKMNLVELAVGEYEIRTIQEKVVSQKPVQQGQGQGQKPGEAESVETMVERTEIVLTHLCTGDYADDCIVAFESGMFKSIALTEHGLAAAKTIGEGLAVEKNPQPKIEEPKAEPKTPQVEPKKEEPKVEPKVEPKAEPKAEPKVEPKEEPKQPQQPPQAPQNPEKPKSPKGE